MLGQQRGAMFVSWAFVRPNEQKTSCVNKLLFFSIKLCRQTIFTRNRTVYCLFVITRPSYSPC